ncbi:hypothetical protein BDY19DRAFT_764453 [Irpex rosettiformis]|uniref:Uncharacterized protein n=1 Tax=Irpex rosettiformis TaxID=378272 RepID=A0ACB8U7H6_9APHY|nr:hypothetical protein BDY19DRAFT_764453 [Irpex rosettiformis]
MSSSNIPRTTREAGLQDASQEFDAFHEIFTPIQLPCGRTIPNRLVKASLYEHLSTFWGGPPNTDHLGLYSHWAYGGWGMVLTGNIQVKGDHLTLGRDLAVPQDVDSQQAQKPFRELAGVIHGKIQHTDRSDDNGTGNDNLAIMQLSHAGRQSTTFFGGRSLFKPPLAPSAIPVQLKPSHARKQSVFSKLISRALFQVPRAMTGGDINDVVEAFVRGAQLAERSGFDGVEVHAAHGYLVAEFISPESNQRTDSYSALTDPLRFLRRIVSAIRTSGVVPKDFVVGVKLNAADYVRSDGNDETRVLGHVKEIAEWGMVDFIEVSGGSYETPDFMLAIDSTEQKSSNNREALFARFSHRARAALLSSSSSSSQIATDQISYHRPLIMLTGGLNTPSLMMSALSNGHADLLGIGRLSVEIPYLPRVLAESGGTIPPASPPPISLRLLDRALIILEVWIRALWSFIPSALRPQFPPLIGAGVGVAAYQVAMRKLAGMPVRPRVSERMVNVDPKWVDVMRLWAFVAPGPWTTRMVDVHIWLGVIGAVVIGVCWVVMCS